MAVYITLTKDEAKSLTALLRGAVTVQVLSDLGLGKLVKLLGQEFEDVRIVGKYGTIERGYSTTPVTVKSDDEKDVYIVTD